MTAQTKQQNNKSKKGKVTALARRSPAAVLKEAKKHLAERPPTVEDLMSQAIAGGNIEAMKELFGMRKEMRAEAAMERYKSELAAFKRECPPIEKKKPVTAKAKDSGERYVKYRYAPLEYIIQIAGPLLVNRGFSWDFDSRYQPEMKGMEISCTLHHELGHSETRGAFAPIDPDAITVSRMNVAQQYNSSISYAKRTAFCNVTGIVPVGEDTDGATTQERRPGGSGKDHRYKQPQEKPSAKAPVGVPAAERPQIEPVSESGKGIDKGTAKGFKQAITQAFKGYGEQAWSVGWDEFRKRFPNIELFSQVPDTPEAKKIILSWIADPSKN